MRKWILKHIYFSSTEKINLQVPLFYYLHFLVRLLFIIMPLQKQQKGSSNQTSESSYEKETDFQKNDNDNYEKERSEAEKNKVLDTIINESKKQVT